MSILKELLNIREEAVAPVELKSLITKAGGDRDLSEKEIEKLWGGANLVWHGESFFGDDDLGPAYKKAEEAAAKLIKAEYGDQFQEVFLGYSPKKDMLYIGFDIWADPEEDEQDEEDEDSNSPDVEFLGGLYEISHNGGRYSAEEISSNEGGFYRGVYYIIKNDKSIIRLRLD